MAKNKTFETVNSVEDFLQNIPDEQRRLDCSISIEKLSQASGMKPKMWGVGIVGFGSYHYKYDSGHEGDAPLIGLASRAKAITYYIGNFDDKTDLLSKLGKHTIGKGCLYIKQLKDIDMQVFEEILAKAFEQKKKLHQND